MTIAHVRLKVIGQVWSVQPQLRVMLVYCVWNTYSCGDKQCIMCYCGRLVCTVERWLLTQICCQGTTFQAPKSLTALHWSWQEHVSSHICIATVVQFAIHMDCFAKSVHCEKILVQFSLFTEALSTYKNCHLTEKYHIKNKIRLIHCQNIVYVLCIMCLWKKWWRKMR